MVRCGLFDSSWRCIRKPPPPPPKRVSPLIYVYELSAESNTMLLARRLSSSACALRSYTSTGGVEWSNTLYGAELAIHEALLSSPYRTLDPMAADWFCAGVHWLLHLGV